MIIFIVHTAQPDQIEEFLRSFKVNSVGYPNSMAAESLAEYDTQPHMVRESRCFNRLRSNSVGGIPHAYVSPFTD